MTPERRTAAFRELLISVGEAGKRSPAEGWKSALEVVQAINLAMIDILAPSLAEALLRRAAMGGLPNKAECRALDSLRALEGAVSKIGRTLVKLRGRKERVHEYRGP
jgi:hypothetical protein